MLTCALYRRRIGAYLDGALEGGALRTTAAHLQGCSGCQREAATLRRMQELLRRSAAGPGEPDWTGFWQGVVRGVEDQRSRPIVPARRAWWWSPGVAWGGAVAALMLVSLTLWQTMWTPTVPSPGVIVRSADTEYPGGTMVYSTPERDVTVVWVFGD